MAKIQLVCSIKLAYFVILIIQLVLIARRKLEITIALPRAGTVVCAAVWRAALLPQHLPAAGQARPHQLHPAEVRRGPGLLRGVRGAAHQDQQDIQDIQVSQPCNCNIL